MKRNGRNKNNNIKNRNYMHIGQHIARPLGAMRLFLILERFKTAC